MSNEVLLAAVTVMQVLSIAVSKVIDYFLEKGKTDPIENKIDKLLDADKAREGTIREMARVKAEDSRMLQDLYAMHKVIDDEGRPAWFFPKKMLEMSEDHLTMLRDIALAQKEAALTMKAIIDRLTCLGNSSEKARGN